MQDQEHNIFKKAKSIWTQIEETKKEMVKHSDAILGDRSKLFSEAMLLQLTALVLLSEQQKSLDIKSRYALTLASSIFDHLLSGWNANLHAYYRVSLNLLRIIHESTVFEMAVALNDDTLQKWLKGNLRIPEARKKVKEFLAKTSGEVVAETWGESQSKRWRQFNKLAHASWWGVSIPAAKVRTSSGTPLYSPAGGILNPALCYDLGLMYLKEATDAIVMMGLAFSPLLDQVEELVAQQQVYLSRANEELLKEETID